MVRFAARFHHWVFWLAASLLFAAVFLRTLLIYGSQPNFLSLMGLLAIWLALALSEHALSQRARWYFLPYIAIQTVLVLMLLAAPGNSDLFATLFVILSMQTALKLGLKISALWIIFWAVTSAVLLLREYGGDAVALSLLYAAGSFLVSSFALAIRRSEEARDKADALALQLQQANSELRFYSSQTEELTASRERNRLARDLHDSVTQTVFSMSLTAQSLVLLWERDRGRVGEQLERLSQLVDGARGEMRLLVSELQGTEIVEEGLVPALRRHIDGRRFPEGFSVSLTSEGNGSLSPAEQHSLFRIVQEALNNIVNHAGTSSATINVHLKAPFWIEVEDPGQGFDLQRAQTVGVGLHSMYERAVEVGWQLQVISVPGQGTRVRAEKKATPGEGTHEG